MGFRTVNFDSVVKFNSAASSEFLQFYESHVVKMLQAKSAEPKSRTFAPSSFRCHRKNWFRLRGTQPDVIANPDIALNFKAEVGTARHRIIQSNLKEALGADWISVEDYLKEHPIPYEYTLTNNGLETLVSIQNPPIRFACDGIVRWKGKLYLLEIKTADYSSWDELTDPKNVHMDQVKCYCTLLGIHDVLFLYEDRQFGGMKCYEEHISDLDFKHIIDTMLYIQKMADCNLAPERLPYTDYACRNCEYAIKCKEWG